MPQMMALLLDDEELCVCDFVGALELTQSKASRHLRYLYNAGLVKDRREGVWMHYRLSRELSPEQAVLVEALRAATAADRAGLGGRLAAWRKTRDSGPGVC